MDRASFSGPRRLLICLPPTSLSPYRNRETPITSAQRSKGRAVVRIVPTSPRPLSRQDSCAGLGARRRLTVRRSRV